MAYVNSFDFNGLCSIHGHSTEDTFERLISEEGEVRKATLEEQRNHIDFIVTDANNKEIKYDVKARKKISRQDGLYQDEFIWVEMKNVRGDNGWLYGDADFIAFERENDFLIVDRISLVEVVKLKCNLKIDVSSPKEALYCHYQRRGRKDSLTLIKGGDILPIAVKIIEKNVDEKENDF